MGGELVLGIETSCDETAAALVEGGTRPVSSVVASQISIHRAFGGVVPEMASRQHLDNLPVVVQEALEQADSALDQLAAVAVTNGPGLIGALLVGVSMAKALAFARGLPLVAVHHTVAHVYGTWLTYRGEIPLPAICLVVSGGHTSLLYWIGHDQIDIVGSTRDDAAGEAFDKVARLLGLEYPGGAALEELARAGGAGIYFPRARLEPGSLDFSFSGLKTAVRNYLQQHPGARRADVAAGFQTAVVDVLVEKTLLAAEQYRVSSIVLAGGVAANRVLRQRLDEAAAARGVKLFIPTPELCTDNAAMVAAAGYYRLVRGQTADWSLEAFSRRELEI